MSSPSSDLYLAHILQRLNSDLDFLASTSHLAPSDLSTIKALLPSATPTQSGSLPYPAPISKQPSGNSTLAKRAVPPRPPRHTTTPLVSSVIEPKRCKATWDYPDSQPDDLPFSRGDIIDIVEEPNVDWWRGSCHGRTGIFPSNHVERIPSGQTTFAPPPPHPPTNLFSSPPRTSDTQYGDGDTQIYSSQNTPYVNEKSGPYFPNNNNPYAPQNNNTYVPPDVQPAVGTSAPPPIPAKKNFLHGQTAKRVGTSFASGMGMGAGFAIANDAINAIF